MAATFDATDLAFILTPILMAEAGQPPVNLASRDYVAAGVVVVTAPCVSQPEVIRLT
jgi:hypothetical protein